MPRGEGTTKEAGYWRPGGCTPTTRRGRVFISDFQTLPLTARFRKQGSTPSATPQQRKAGRLPEEGQTRIRYGRRLQAVLHEPSVQSISADTAATGPDRWNDRHMPNASVAYAHIFCLWAGIGSAQHRSGHVPSSKLFVGSPVVTRHAVSTQTGSQKPL